MIGHLPVISLVGMPGGGKSTIGRLLAKRLDLPFADVDRAIEEHAGLTVAALFERGGEAAFRDLESRVLETLIGRGASVVATGGGTVLRAENRALLRERTVPVYLEAALPELWRRVRRNTRRPLLQVADPYARLEQLFGERHPLYREVASITVQTGAPSMSHVVDAIVAQVTR